MRYDKKIVDRIDSHYKNLLNKIMPKNQADVTYMKTFNKVIDKLMPYAINDNYWWEEKSEKMAYYQKQIDILVVDPVDFEKYYKELIKKENNKKAIK